MRPLASLETALLLVAGSMAADRIADRLRVPPAVAHVLLGLALALSPWFPTITLDPDFALALFLPPLLMHSALQADWSDFRRWLRAIFNLAVGAVLFSTVVVGLVAHLLLPAVPLAACFALGAILSPPDAAAAKAVLRRGNLPHRLVAVLEGESLVNDATALVLYRFAVAAAVSGSFHAGAAALQFLAVGAGGLAVGAVLGMCAVPMLTWLGEANRMILGSFLAAWCAYLGAEAFDLSGVLATVSCGLVVGSVKVKRLTPATRAQAIAVWDFFVSVLESLAFVLIGLALRNIAPGLHAEGLSYTTLLPIIAVIGAALVLARFAWMMPHVWLDRRRSRRRSLPDPVPHPGLVAVAGWAGMRGGVSLAAAVALPPDFPGRNAMVAITFGVVLVSVLGHATTLAPLARWLRVAEHEESRFAPSGAPSPAQSDGDGDNAMAPRSC